ncbi:MAG: TrmB family transcriptional regulator [Bacteroidales bacterium]|nr:TrmB family transcriptional regulator [Bacteroidales bacterium]
MQKEFIEKLKIFGLNSYEAKIWVALLSRGVSSAGELSDISNVPRSRSYDVLESLEKKGFIVMKIGKPIKYIAVPPNEVLERVKGKIKEDADAQARNLENLRESDVLGELSSLHNKGVELVEPTELTASFRGRNKVYEQILLMLKEAEEEFILVSTEEGLVRKLDFLSRAFKKAHERGVKIKIAAPITKKETKEAIKLIEDFAEVRKVKDLRARFAIADGEEIAFLLFDDDAVHPTYDVGVWVNTPFFASAVQQLFDLAWNELEIVVKVQN